MPEVNPYYKPGILSVSSSLLETSHQQGLKLVEVLTTGDVSPLPAKVIEFLIAHSGAINATVIGQKRFAIAKSIESPPYTSGDAIGAAKSLAELIDFSNDAAVQISMTDVVVGESVRVRFPQFFPEE